MSDINYESTLNTWLAEALSGENLDAKPERAQGGGRRLDVEIELEGVKIALEAEQGESTAKRASAIRDADGRLRDGLADCAVAICYPDGLNSAADVAGCHLLHSLRTYRHQPIPSKTAWTRGNIAQLAGVIRRIPEQMGDPDNIANFLSGALDRAVARLSESQKMDLAQTLDLPQGRAMKTAYGNAQTSRYNQAAKRAMLVIATAVMFHARLDTHRNDITPLWDHRFSPPRSYEGAWPPEFASNCADDADPVGAFADAWDLWLVVDYKPIFATARNALRGLAQNSAFTAAVRSVATAALKVTRNIVGLRHDLLGRIFHRVLETARYDGSFYTTTAAATLLATLAIDEDMCDWSDRSALATLRFTDPACGTGTLLMAAAERIRDLTRGAQNGDISRPLIEQILTGYDVNMTATHLAATTLGLLSPTTTFRNMKIGRALLGVTNGKAYLGSLEFLSRDQLPKILPWPTGVEEIESAREIEIAEAADLVIMNPPFTRDSLRHDQFSREEERRLKAREKEIFAGQPIHLSSNGNSFLVLAERIAKKRGSAVAAVLPMVTATNASSADIRRFLAKQFHVETIVATHDPTRLYFSENTSISEMLLVCRRWDESAAKPATKVVNLHHNPATPVDALSVARYIVEGKREEINGTLQFWPAERIAKGDWGAVQFLSPFLCETFVAMRSGQLFRTRSLSELADISPDGRGIRGMFRRSVYPDAHARVALWDHDTDIVQSMAAQDDSYIIPKPGKEVQACALWEKRGCLLLAMRARLNTARVVSVRLPYRALGSAWVPCKPISNYEALDIHTLEEAICAYLNSTIGLLAILGNRSIRQLSYSQFSMDDLRRIPVPDFNALDERQITTLATAYDSLRELALLPLPQIQEDEVRKALDRAVVRALDLDAETIKTIRHHLTREPAITAKPYAPKPLRV